MQPADDRPLDIEELRTAELVQLVAHGLNERVLARLHDAGYSDVRASFGYVVQHLLSGAKGASELARLLGISQQAVSKRLQEMRRLGLVVDVRGADGRTRLVGLSPRGKAMREAARDIRGHIDAELWKGLPGSDRKALRDALIKALNVLGMEDVVRSRAVREYQ
jgi:DNA-binding MarR family transcriptional regulator